MIIVKYNKNEPQQKIYSFGVQQNNKVDVVYFDLDRNFLNLNQVYVKVCNREHDYFDKILLEEYQVNGNVARFLWLVPQKVMSFGNVEIQIQTQFSAGEIWQTEIVIFEFESTINADHEIDNNYPYAIVDLEKKVADLEQEVGSGVAHLNEPNTFTKANTFNDKINLKGNWYIDSNGNTIRFQKYDETNTTRFNFGRKAFYRGVDFDSDLGTATRHWQNTYTDNIIGTDVTIATDKEVNGVVRIYDLPNDETLAEFSSQNGLVLYGNLFSFDPNAELGNLNHPFYNACIAYLHGENGNEFYVDDLATQADIQNVREVAEGKCKTYVFSITTTAPTTDAEARLMYKGDSNARFNDLSDFNNYVNGLSLGNPILNSTAQSVNTYGYYFIEEDTFSGDSRVYRAEDIFEGSKKKGDEVLVVQTDVPDRWCDGDYLLMELEVKTDLSNYPTKNGNETITGNWTWDYGSGLSFKLANGNKMGFSGNQWNYLQIDYNGAGMYSIGTSSIFPNSNNSRDLGTSSLAWRDLYLGRTAYVGTGYAFNSNGNLDLIGTDNAVKYRFTNAFFRPNFDNVSSLGESDKRFTNAYFSGQVYAQNTFNVINASDITSNTLTQAQYDLITNGKPTLISGTYLGYKNMLLTYWNEYATTWRCLAISGANVFSMLLNTTTFALTEGGDDITLKKITNFNGKTIPSYPSSPAEDKVLTYKTNNTMAWESAGGGGGTKLYQHQFSIGGVRHRLICARQEAFANMLAVGSYLASNPEQVVSFKSQRIAFTDSSLGYVDMFVWLGQSASPYLKYRYLKNDGTFEEVSFGSNSSLTDDITPL